MVAALAILLFGAAALGVAAAARALARPLPAAALGMGDPGRPFWLPSEALRRHANRTVSGDAGIDWLTHVRLRHLAVPPRRVLVVGCGEGFLELALARMFRSAAIAGVDADAEAVARAARRADRRALSRVTHHALELETGALPAGEWDAVFVQNLLHRLADPEGLLRRVHDALAPSGRVVLSAYVGPSGFEYPAPRVAIVRRYARLLPIGLRFDPDTGRPLPRPAQAAPPSGGPGESAVALALARRIFVEEALYRGGGGLLQPLLAGLEPRAAGCGALDERLLAVLAAAEEDLHARGLVADDFAIFVGRRRAASRMT